MTASTLTPRIQNARGIMQRIHGEAYPGTIKPYVEMILSIHRRTGAQVMKAGMDIVNNRAAAGASSMPVLAAIAEIIDPPPREEIPITAKTGCNVARCHEMAVDGPRCPKHQKAWVLKTRQAARELIQIEIDRKRKKK